MEYTQGSQRLSEHIIKQIPLNLNGAAEFVFMGHKIGAGEFAAIEHGPRFLPLTGISMKNTYVIAKKLGFLDVMMYNESVHFV